MCVFMYVCIHIFWHCLLHCVGLKYHVLMIFFFHSLYLQEADMNDESENEPQHSDAEVGFVL